MGKEGWKYLAFLGACVGIGVAWGIARAKYDNFMNSTTAGYVIRQMLK
jgi:hypothetical protein